MGKITFGELPFRCATVRINTTSLRTDIDIDIALLEKTNANVQEEATSLPKYFNPHTPAVSASCYKRIISAPFPN